MNPQVVGTNPATGVRPAILWKAISTRQAPMILHVDMDAFYASVEQRDQPQLAGRPVIVGGTPDGRGVVAAASYEARAFGVHSAQPAAAARRLCPTAIFLRPRMEHYAAISEQIHEVFGQFTPLVEPLALDEAFLDVSRSTTLFGSPVDIAKSIKKLIRNRLQLVASVGVAPNKFLAKLASDLEKPDGLVVVEPDRIQSFLDPLPIGRIWGVGRVTGDVFRRIGIRTIRDLRRLTVADLTSHFGNQGEHLWQLARGVDARPVVADHDVKSISHETTFSRDVTQPEVLEAWLLELCDQVGARLRRRRLKGRTVQLKVRFSDFRTITRSETLREPTDVTRDICDSAIRMITGRLPRRKLSVRLVGVGLSNLTATGSSQRPLFPDPQHERQQRLDEVTDRIKLEFGSSALQRGSGMLHDIRPRHGSDEANPDQFGPNDVD